MGRPLDDDFSTFNNIFTFAGELTIIITNIESEFKRIVASVYSCLITVQLQMIE